MPSANLPKMHRTLPNYLRLLDRINSEFSNKVSSILAQIIIVFYFLRKKYYFSQLLIPFVRLGVDRALPHGAQFAIEL